MIELDQDNLAEIVKSNPKVLVQYGAGWCGHCRMLKPKFKNLSEERKDITFVYADAEKFPGSRELAEVSNLPTFAYFEAGSLVQQKQGNKFEVVKELVDATSSD